MPLRLNVGASRKITDDNYGSRGASVNLEIELDSGLVMDSAKLQERIRQLFGLVRQSLAEELNASRNGPNQPPPNSSKPLASSGQPVNGRKQSNGKQNAPRLATPAQVKALYAIAKQRGCDLHDIVHDRFGLERPEQFTIQQASELIDALKSANE